SPPFLTLTSRVAFLITRDVPAATAAGTGCPPSPPGPTPGETGAPGGAAGVAPPATAASDAALVDCAALGTGAPGLAATAVVASLAARTPGGEVRSSSSDDRRRGAVPGAVHRREVNRR